MDQSSNCPGDIIIASDRRKAIEELVRGREKANMLRALLVSGSLRGHGSSVMSVDHLLTQILSSFANTLSLLMNNNNSGGVVGDSDQVRSPPTSRKSEDTGDSSKCTPPAPVIKDRRGCYKKRKTSHRDSWTTYTPDLVDDGHAWRKYGQKLILNAKHPRNYFRCTHKYNQHCQATKQVQRLDEEPPVYRTTYQGHHTCSNAFPLPVLEASSQLILDPADNTDSSKLISFNNSDVIALANNDHRPFFFGGSSQLPLQVPSVKHEYYNTCTTKENVPIINYGPTHHRSSSSSCSHRAHDDCCYFFLSDHDTFDEAWEEGVISFPCATWSTTNSLSSDHTDNIGPVLDFDDEEDVLRLIDHQFPLNFVE